MPELRKEFNLFTTLTLIVSGMVGSGIFLTPNSAFSEVGSPAMLLLVFGLTGAWSLGGQLCYAELGTLIGQSGAEYSFFKYGFQSGLPAFMYTWVSCLLTRTLTLAILSLTFARYEISAFVPCGMEGWAPKAVAIAMLAFLCVLNSVSVKWVAQSQAALFILKIAALSGIAIMGLVALGQDRQSYLSRGFAGTSSDVGSIGLAFYSAQWSYSGWAEANYVLEELKDPKLLVKSAFIAVPLVMLCYELVLVAYMTILPEAVFQTSKTVAVAAGEVMIGPAARVIFPLVVAMSCLGTGTVSLLTASRIVHEAGKNGDFPHIFSLVHNKLQTPIIAVTAQTALSVIFVVAVDVNTLVTMVGFVSGIIYSTSMLVLLLLRRRQPDAQRGIKVPIFVPVLVLIPSILFTVVPFIRYPLGTSIMAVAMLTSIPAYYVVVSRRFGRMLHPYLDRASAWSSHTACRFLDVG